MSTTVHLGYIASLVDKQYMSFVLLLVRMTAFYANGFTAYPHGVSKLTMSDYTLNSSNITNGDNA